MRYSIWLGFVFVVSALFLGFLGGGAGCVEPNVSVGGVCCPDSNRDGACDGRDSPIVSSTTVPAASVSQGMRNNSLTPLEFMVKRKECSQLGKPGYPEELLFCITRLGALVGDPKFCNRFETREKNDCLSAVGLSKRDPSICDTAGFPDDCYLTVGIGLKDIDVCNEWISDRNITELCIDMIGASGGGSATAANP